MNIATGLEQIEQTQFLNCVSPASFLAPDYVDLGSAWVEHIPFAFWLVGALAPATIVELGTYNGCSYLAFCQAVAHLRLDARCFAVDTWQGDDHTGAYGEEVFTGFAGRHGRYGAFSSLVRSSFSEALPHFQDGSIDLLHIDGRHFYEDVAGDFRSWLPKLSARAVVLFHDTNARERRMGVSRFFGEIRARYPHFEFLHGSGLGVLGVGGRIPESIVRLCRMSAHPSAAADLRAIYFRLGRAVSDAARLAQGRPAAPGGDEDQEVDRLRAELAAQAARLSYLRAVLGKSTHERHALGSKLAELESRLAHLLDSSSWRVTAPLRSAKRLIDRATRTAAGT
ncbi:MAG: class I SAM-dependent methyltransferase [Xanthobacteraceae bacterium]|nr:class I SAM-dependent methyltransferase [Xanthobacteraceae bacterium]